MKTGYRDLPCRDGLFPHVASKPFANHAPRDRKNQTWTHLWEVDALLSAAGLMASEAIKIEAFPGRVDPVVP